jgi:hypothetical protein
MDFSGSWENKDTKTQSSGRFIYLPAWPFSAGPLFKTKLAVK